MHRQPARPEASEQLGYRALVTHRLRTTNPASGFAEDFALYECAERNAPGLTFESVSLIG